MYKGRLKLLTGNANPELAKKIAKILGVHLTPVKTRKFADGEIYVKILESVRGQDVFVIQPTCHPVNDNLIELLIMIDALKRSSPARINIVMPFYGYARQDRKSTSREAITAKLVADLLQAAGAQRIIAADLHADQIQGFFNIPLDHMVALPIIADYFKQKKIKDLVVVSPDEGGIKLNKRLALRLNVPLTVITKERSGKTHDTIEDMTILGEVKGRNVIILDDEINTGGTIVRASELLKKGGARDVYIACTHGILCGKAIQKLKAAPVKEVVITDTVPLPKEKRISKIKVISMAPVIAETIKIINSGEPMGVFLDSL